MRVINIHTIKPEAGTNPNHVYIGRPKAGEVSKYGNPYVIGVDGSRDEVIQMFKDLLWENLKAGRWTVAELIEDLNGKVLECFCFPKRCHGDVLIAAVKHFCEKTNTPFIQAEATMLVEEKSARVVSRATEKRAHEYYRDNRQPFQKGQGEQPLIPSLQPRIPT